MVGRDKRKYIRRKNEAHVSSHSTLYLLYCFPFTFPPIPHPSLPSLRYPLYHRARGPNVPFEGVHPTGNTMPLVHCVCGGARGCRRLSHPSLPSLTYPLYHRARGPNVPFEGVHPTGNTMPLVHCVCRGARGCRRL